MSYTPINWQTGDQITAEKMNKMDNGWGVDTSVQTLFNGNVTTADEGGMYIGAFAVAVTAETITVTFNNTEYTLSRTEPFEGTYGYGEAGEMGPDFTNYPFYIMCPDPTFSQLYTETSGTFALKIDGAISTLEVSDNFKSAVSVGGADSFVSKNDFEASVPFKITFGETTFGDVITAFSEGRFVYATKYSMNQGWYVMIYLLADQTNLRLYYADINLNTLSALSIGSTSYQSVYDVILG